MHHASPLSIPGPRCSLGFLICSFLPPLFVAAEEVSRAEMERDDGDINPDSEGALPGLNRIMSAKVLLESPSFCRHVGSGDPTICKRISSMSEGREWGVGCMVLGSAFGAPQIFAPNRSETLQNKAFGTSRLKIGAPQKRRFNDDVSNAPFSAL